MAKAPPRKTKPRRIEWRCVFFCAKQEPRYGHRNFTTGDAASFLWCFCHCLFLMVDSPRSPKSSGIDSKKALIFLLSRGTSSCLRLRYFPPCFFVCGVSGCACVLHVRPFFLLVDIQHTQCPRQFFILERYKLCGHKTTTQTAMMYQVDSSRGTMRCRNTHTPAMHPIH